MASQSWSIGFSIAAIRASTLRPRTHARTVRPTLFGKGRVHTRGLFAQPCLANSFSKQSAQNLHERTCPHTSGLFQRTVCQTVRSTFEMNGLAHVRRRQIRPFRARVQVGGAREGDVAGSAAWNGLKGEPQRRKKSAWGSPQSPQQTLVRARYPAGQERGASERPPS